MPETVERTENEILARDPIKVGLGTKEFSITPQCRKQSRQFRKSLGEALKGIDELIDLGAAFADTSGKRNMDAGRALVVLRQVIAQNADAMLDLIYEYDPVLQTEREYIENNATDDQCIDALIEIMKLVLAPFVKHLPLQVEQMKKPIETQSL